jgi:predicted RNA methylase
MFNKDFFPTPKEVIEQMMFGVDIADNVFLEPSAGKGNIVDYLKEHYAKEVLACEINNDLAKILSGKARLIANDFLTVRAQDISHVHCIVMNPPFSADETHILHAWDIAPGGCAIISLCNDNTVNQHWDISKKRQELHELIKLYGKSESFGDCFSNAERKTGVDVACVWLYKPKMGDDEFSDYFSLTDDEIENLEQGLVRYNYVRDIVNRYVGAIMLFDKIEPLAREINDLTKPISEHGIKFGAYETGKSNYGSTEIKRETYKKELQKQAWRRIFQDMKMNKYVTKGVQATINKFIETQVHVPFTMKNVYKMIEIIVGTHGSRMQKVLVEAFEMICAFSWKENCTGGEKWKTNSDYVINKRFIVPYITSTWYASEYIKLGSSGNRDIVEDIQKALCHLTGMNYENCTTLSAFVGRQQLDWGKWYEWGFFRIRGYKKGTMHFEFADENVLDIFNKRVAEIKGWALPQTSNSTKRARKKSTGLSKVCYCK